MKKKTVIAMLSVLAIALVAIGGTLAWLKDSTVSVTNTFTVGDIDITLKESPYDPETNDYDDPAENVSNAYPMIPGAEYTKDPTVAVSDTSEDCWLFVKFEENNDPDDYLTYTSALTAANGWTQGDGTAIPANVWYRKVLKTDTTRSWALLTDNKIAVKGDAVTKENIETAADAELVYTAYAVQSANISTADDAWAKL